MEKWLHDILPIMDVEHDCIVSKLGDITVVYKVELPELFTLSDAEYEAFHLAWVKAIKVLPTHSILHKQDWFCEAAFKPEFGVEKSFLSVSSDRFFNERPYLEHGCYLLLTKKPEGGKPASSLYSSLLKGSIVPTELLQPKTLKNFEDKCGQFKKIMEDTGLVKFVRLKDQDLSSGVRHKGIIESYCFLSSVAKPFVVRDIVFDEGIRVGDNYCNLYTLSDVEDLPALCGPRINYDKYSTDKTKFSVGFAATLGQMLSCNHIYNQYIFIDDAQATLKKIESKRLRLQSLSAYSRENLIARDAANEFLNEAISMQRLPVKAHFNILVWTNEKEKLAAINNMVSSAIAQMDGVVKQETVGAPQIFWAGIPGNAADFPLNDTFDTFLEQATCFFNQETSYRSSISPKGLRLGDRLSGKPVHVDLSDEPLERGVIGNLNKFIVAPSGAGKSFLSCHMERSYYEQDTHCVIVDVGHSYKNLCSSLGGYYFTYSEADPIRFNPFYVAPGDSLDVEKKESLKSLLVALWKKDDERYTRSEYVALSNALQGYFDKLAGDPSLFPCFNSFYEYLKQEFVEVLKQDNVKEKDFDVNNFLYVLRPYYKSGEFDYLLNAEKNLDLLQQRFIVFELDNIKDHPILFPVVTLIIMDVFISKMRKVRGVRKTILIEEAWKAIAKEGMAEYIRYLFKTVRKFYGEAWIVTQEIEDIVSSPIIKNAIINSCDCKILGDQSKYQNKFGIVQELLGLTDKEKMLALSLNKANDPRRRYKEFFFSLGGQLAKVYRVEVSPEEYWTYTTQDKEKLKVEQYRQRYGTMEQAIKMLVLESKN